MSLAKASTSPTHCTAETSICLSKTWFYLHFSKPTSEGGSSWQLIPLKPLSLLLPKFLLPKEWEAY